MVCKLLLAVQYKITLVLLLHKHDSWDWVSEQQGFDKPIHL